MSAQLARPQLLIAAAVWIMLIAPVLAGIAFNAIDLRGQSPALLLALVLNMVAPPIFASPALAALMGLNAAITLDAELDLAQTPGHVSGDGIAALVGDHQSPPS